MERQIDINAAEDAVRRLLVALGEDVTREGLLETPRRVASMFAEQCTGNGKALDTAFAEEYDEMMLVRDMPMMSFCEHHLLPWYGKWHVAYIPNKKVLGLSKFARLGYEMTKGLTIQEHVTDNLANWIKKTLDPLGCMVIIEAVHTCMSLRGAKSIGSLTTTSAVRGVFRDNPMAKQEFLLLLNRPRTIT